jgi:hypothetical protein
MRGGEALTFATESFVDEMAPRAPSHSPTGSAARWHTEAGAGDNVCSQNRGWDGGGAGSNLGLACASIYGSHIGLLTEATVAPTKGSGCRGWSQQSTRVVSSTPAGPATDRGWIIALAAAVIPAPDMRRIATRADAGQGFERLHEVPNRVELIGTMKNLAGEWARHGGARAGVATHLRRHRQAPEPAVRSDERRMTRADDGRPMSACAVQPQHARRADPGRAALLGRILSDPRVVEIPKFIWKPILHGIIRGPARPNGRRLS